MRVAIAPGVWRDDGPQTASARQDHFAVSASTGAAMVPILSNSAAPVTAAETRRRKYRREKIRAEAKPRPVCGFVPSIRGAGTGEPCARRPGHKDCHRSRSLMDRDMQVRRAGWRGTDK